MSNIRVIIFAQSWFIIQMVFPSNVWFIVADVIFSKTFHLVSLKWFDMTLMSILRFTLIEQRFGWLMALPWAWKVSFLGSFFFKKFFTIFSAIFHTSSFEKILSRLLESLQRFSLFHSFLRFKIAQLHFRLPFRVKLILTTYVTHLARAQLNEFKWTCSCGGILSGSANRTVSRPETNR